MISKKIKSIVVGYGSAGQRHCNNLESLGYEVAIVSSFNTVKYDRYEDLSKAIDSENPNFVVIASPNYRHVQELEECITKKIPCLIEKPLSTSLKKLKNIIDHDRILSSEYRVAYLLRYHPFVQRALIDIEKIKPVFQASLRYGNYLPWWRPGTDYRNSYSSKESEGGGVLFDLSHEVDLITYFFGPVNKLLGITRKISSLEITSNDLCVVMFEMKSGQFVELSLDYFNKIPERKIIINGSKGTIKIDLINSVYKIYNNGRLKIDRCDLDLNHLFKKEIYDFAEKRIECLLPDLNESMKTLSIFDAVKESNKLQEWVNI